jgi:hypothetical protein
LGLKQIEKTVYVGWNLEGNSQHLLVMI